MSAGRLPRIKHSCFTLGLALGVGLLGPAVGATAEEQEDGSSGNRVELKQVEGAVEVLIDGELFTRLNYADTSKPYLYPIIGPAGTPMTRSYPMVGGVEGEAHDHPHHQSLWFAHGDISGVDYWHLGEKYGYTVVDETAIIDQTVLLIEARLLPENDPGQEQAKLATALDFQVDADGTRVIDYQVMFKPTDPSKPLVFGDTKEGTMAIRVHPALRLKGDIATGHCANSEGHTDFECWGKRAKWVAYWGEIEGKTVGLAVFDHPTNLRHPTWWHARDYGLVAANPFGIHDFEKDQPEGTGDYTPPAGQGLGLSYRFVFFEGAAEQADVAGKYEAWVKATAAEPEDDGEQE